MPLKDHEAYKEYQRGYWRQLRARPGYPEYQANKWMKAMYGITMAEYTRMAVSQGGKCAICGVTPKPNKGRLRPLHIDHDHITQRVRGLLCHPCNVSLHALERPEWRQRAESYLAKAK